MHFPMTAPGSPQFSISSLKAETALSDLIHRAGHDIGNPLTSLISLASLVERAQRDPALQLDAESLSKYSSTMIADAWRIQGISEKLVLILSDRGKGFQPVDAAPILQQCIKKILRKPAFQNCDVVFAPPAGSMLMAVDPAQLEWLAGELLLNALIHVSVSPSGDTENVQSIQVRLEQTGPNRTRLTVENELREAPAADLSTLFEPFVRYPIQSRGAGLGLTAAWAVVERAGGTILLEMGSLEMGGSFFRASVELPSE